MYSTAPEDRCSVSGDSTFAGCYSSWLAAEVACAGFWLVSASAHASGTAYIARVRATLGTLIVVIFLLGI